MNDMHLIDLELIDPNPDQVSGTEDEAKVLELAESLKRNRDNGMKGLLQVPMARLIDGRAQLAFGHTRKAAFVFLAKDDPFFGQMPLIVRELTDLEMFETLAAENFKRRDISQIEKARLMHAYMTKHGKTSVEAGEFFGVSDDTVRGTVRLLGLPESVQKKIEIGEINVSVGRMLLTAQKVVSADVLEVALEDLAEKIFDTPEEAIKQALLIDAQRMDSNLSWLDAKKFPIKYLAPLQKKVVAELLDVVNGDIARKELLNQVMQLIAGGMEITDNQFSAFMPNQLEKVRILANPPACTSCAMHIQFDGSHYCGLKLCYERKEKAWAQAEAAKLLKEIGIPLYVNEQTDGKAVELSRWEQTDQKLFAERHEDLRLRPTTRTIWNNFEGLPHNLVLVAVGKTAEKRLKAKEKKEEKEETSRDNEKTRMLTRGLRDNFINRFQWEVATAAFESLLDGMTNLPFSLYLYKEVMLEWADLPEGIDDRNEQLHKLGNSKKKADALKQLRRLMIFDVLDAAFGWEYNQYQGTNKPLLVLAKRAQKVAEEWGVKLPKDWMAQAEQYQAELDKAIKEISKKVK